MKNHLKNKKNEYLCTGKQMLNMNGLMKLALAVLLAASCGSAMAQSEGVGVTNPQATFHVHSYSGWLPSNGIDPETPDLPHGIPDGLNNSGNVGPEMETIYCATMLLTNNHTGSTSTDGLLIQQQENDITIQQNELGVLQLVNHGGKFVMNQSGLLGVGNTHVGVKFNVEGSGRFTQGVSLLSTLTVGGAATLNGGLSVGSGFACDANGNLKVKHLKVTLTDWPDYVFGGDHALMPLGELEAYIGEHQHLPGIPTAAEVEQEGADLGEMNRLLMEKVEELTLYIIDLQKQIDEMKNNK